MRAAANILHLDLDAFFAAVEQRDKPSLRGKAVVVGGSGPRGVVATASYEARRRAPHAAFLGGRFEAYRQSSRIVMNLLREVSPVVEPLSLDEAYVDLAAGGWDLSRLEVHVEELRAEVTRRTAGLTASVGVGTSMFVAKVASEAAKPNGSRIIRPGEELDFIAPLPVRAVPGVGPVTEQRLLTLGLATIAELRAADERELVRELGRAAGESLHRLAFARDDRRVQPERETKSISTEDTFAIDIRDRAELVAILRRDADEVARRVRAAAMFARTVGIKVRMADFTTITRARSLAGATDRAETIAAVGEELLADVDVRDGVRLLGIGASNFTRAAQEQLFDDDPAAEGGPGDPDIGATDGAAGLGPNRPDDADDAGSPGGLSDAAATPALPTAGVRGRGYYPGADVVHDEFGRGWVWGLGRGLVTVRFETRDTPPGPVRTFPDSDPALRLAPDLPAL